VIFKSLARDCADFSTIAAVEVNSQTAIGERVGPRAWLRRVQWTAAARVVSSESSRLIGRACPAPKAPFRTISRDEQVYSAFKPFSHPPANTT
jgi:hypothetical protein